MGTPTEAFVIAQASQTYTALANDNELVLALAANTRYAVRVGLIYTGSVGTNQLAISFAVPAGCTLQGVQQCYPQSTGAGSAAGSYAAASPLGMTVGAANDINRFEIFLVCLNGANAGNLQLKGQRTVGAANIDRLPGSYMMASHL